jgi:glycosyltransferase involved in cell wall biosynthesis
MTSLRNITPTVRTSVSKPSISALVIAKNESEMIGACLKTLSWCNEVLVLDSGSTDNTREIAETFGARVISFKHQSFSRLREEILKRAKSDWVIYVDADERVTPTLAKEVQVAMETTSAVALELARDNIHYGRLFKAGGWQNDVVTRVFKKSELQGWQGDIHESPVYKGSSFRLNTPLMHLTHRNVVDGLRKTSEWTPMEAAQLAAEIPLVSFGTIARKGLMEFIRRAILKRGYQDGMPGLIESLTQAINRMLVYMQVWELQQKPPISKRYEAFEAEIEDQWDKHS